MPSTIFPMVGTCVARGDAGKKMGVFGADTGLMFCGDVVQIGTVNLKILYEIKVFR